MKLERKFRIHKHVPSVLLTCLMLTTITVANTIDLSGTWLFAIDRDDVGQQANWFRTRLPGEHTLHLPATMQAQGFGDTPGPSTPWVGNIRQEEWDKPKYAPYRTADNFKMPFWLQPDKYYKGPAWYQKTVTIPRTWKSKHITLSLERPHWQTTLWIDSIPAGSADYLSVPHTYDLSGLLTPGKHTLTIRVDNRQIVNVGPNSHSVSDHTQSNWNGIVGRIELTAEPAARIDDVQIYPDMQNNAVRVITQLQDRSGRLSSGDLIFDVFRGGKKVTTSKTEVKLDPAGTRSEVLIPLETSVKKWDEFNPNLYTLNTRLETVLGTTERLATFGMREITLQGNRIILNDRRAFMRGTLECCIFPKTGHPPTDVESWKRIIRICKAHGLNHIRFHSWCPPEAAFVAADELGFYYQVECSSWANQGSGLGGAADIDRWIYDEADAILKAYGNHPSFLLFAYGNEPSGPERGARYLRKWVSHYKQKDPRRLVTSASGWPLIDESDFHVSPTPRIQGWGQQLNSRINSKSPETASDYRSYVNRYPDTPVISHEIGQWCVYPDFDEVKKYTGILKPKNFEVFRDFLEQKNMLDQAHDFLMASGKLQTLCYKEDIESSLRTPNFGGFQLLDLHDFPGQGTALVGILDPFWNSKPYVSPAEYHRFCAPIVPLARMSKRIFTSSDTFSAQIDISHFGPTDLTDVKVKWSLLSTDGNTVRQGTLHKNTMPAGDLYTIDNITLSLSDLPAPAKYTLQLVIDNTDAINDWDIWIYPDTVVDTRTDDNILVANYLDSKTTLHLQRGGKVLLNVSPPLVRTTVKLGFSSIFWNTAWTGGQAPHTLGILCDPKHPALKAFPTEYHSNWQWSSPIRNAAAMELDHLPASLDLIVQIVPDWFEPKRLGLLFEAKVTSGSIIVSSIDLSRDLEHRPVERQLLRSLLSYMRSDTFNPQTSLSIKSIKSLFTEPSPLQKLNAEVINVDSQEAGYEGIQAIDNDPTTMWHTQWSSRKPSHPHEIQIDLRQSIVIDGLTCLPRQDGNPNGFIDEYAVYLSSDANHWGPPIIRGRFANNSALKTIRFNESAAGQYLRFVALSGFDSDIFTSIAELNVITGR